MKIKDILEILSKLHSHGFELVRYGGLGQETSIDDLVLEAVYEYESLDDEWEDEDIEFLYYAVYEYESLDGGIEPLYDTEWVDIRDYREGEE